MKGVVGINAWNVLIVGIIALVFLMIWNEFAAGQNIGGVTVGRV